MKFNPNALANLAENVVRFAGFENVLHFLDHIEEGCPSEALKSKGVPPSIATNIGKYLKTYS